MPSNSLNRTLLWQAKNGALQKNWCGIGAEHTSLTQKTIENKGDLIYMKLGIVGLPNVGKSTLFNSLTKAGAESANYPFCTIDPVSYTHLTLPTILRV